MQIFKELREKNWKIVEALNDKDKKLAHLLKSSKSTDNNAGEDSENFTVINVIYVF
jgi:hypothetical protein